MEGMNLLQEEARADLLATLQSFSIFFDVSRKALEMISGFSRVLRFKEDQTIIEEGDRNNLDLFLLVKGPIKVSLGRDEVGQPAEIAFTPQQMRIFGEVSCVMKCKRTATIIAAGDVQVIAVDGKQLHDFMENYPQIGYLILKNLFETMVERLRATNALLKSGVG